MMKFLPITKLSRPTFQADLARATLESNTPRVAQIFGELARDLGRLFGPTILGLPVKNLVVVGLGGDFREFCIPLMEAMSLPRFSIGCLWPVQARGKDPAARETIFFQQEYFEPSNEPDLVVIVQSIVDGAVPTAAVIERVRELTNTNVPILLLAGAAKPATLQFLEQVPNVVSWAAGGLTKSVDLDYWKVSALFDRRDMKIVPRMSMWLLDRMDWYDARLRAAAKPTRRPTNNRKTTINRLPRMTTKIMRSYSA
jgi:hypothetical protein